MNPTVDNIFAAMGWYRDAFRTAEEMAELLARGETTVAYWPKAVPRRRLAPRWQVPAIRRRQAARRTA